MRFLIITGLSGSGKTLTLKCLEDMGYFCVDNLPPVLIPKLADICRQGRANMDKVAMVVDMRGGELFSAITESLQILDETGFHYEILYIDADIDTIVMRYKEIRKNHPLSPNGRLMDGINLEIDMLSEIREHANNIINTSNMPPSKLKELLAQEYGDEYQENISVVIVSFGFKRGIPVDADMVFDVRILPNPFYIGALRSHSGKDTGVRDYVFSFPEAQVFVDKTADLINYILPYYLKEAKKDIVIAIGCTGGMHRSVAVAEALYKKLHADRRRMILEHRDMENERAGSKYHHIE